MTKKIFGYIAILSTILTLMVGYTYADSNGIWHEAEDVRPGVFGADENGTIGSYIFNDTVAFNNDTSFMGFCWY